MKNTYGSYGNWKHDLESHIGHKIEEPVDLEWLGPLYTTGISPWGAYGWWKLRKGIK